MSEHRIAARLLETEVTIHLAGCGGNGAQMLYRLARMDRAIRSLGHPAGIYVRAFDPDLVSAANLGRQLFTPDDIGRNKADVLVQRVNLFHGLSWDAEPEAYGGQGETYESDYFGARTSMRRACDILITCVDSAKARREIHHGITQHRRGAQHTPLYWLDLGNTQSTGQVVLGEPIDAVNAQGSRRPRLPTVVEVFPELLDETIPEDNRPSCSLAEALESQDLFINDLIVGWAGQLLWDLFRKGKITKHGAFINAGDYLVSPLPVPAPNPEKPARKTRARQ
ncbi:MAG: PRTRC system ThiF family protein [Armatimonadota bacterium]